MDLLEITQDIVFSVSTGAKVSPWEEAFVETLSQKIQTSEQEGWFWLSPAQRRSLFRLADKLDLFLPDGDQP